MKIEGFRSEAGGGCTEGNVIHVLVNCSETQMYRQKFLNRKWPTVSGEVAYKKLSGCVKISQLKQLGKFVSLDVCGRTK